jgi:hypothetical protein
VISKANKKTSASDWTTAHATSVPWDDRKPDTNLSGPYHVDVSGTVFAYHVVTRDMPALECLIDNVPKGHDPMDALAAAFVIDSNNNSTLSGQVGFWSSIIENPPNNTQLLGMAKSAGQ